MIRTFALTLVVLGSSVSILPTWTTGKLLAQAPSAGHLNVTGTTLRRAFALVIHDSTQQRGAPSDWKPAGKCGP
jgi:hypothetical protein